MHSPPLFWLFAFVLAAGVLVALVWPLLRHRASEAPGDEAAATAVFRDHKRQLDDDFVAGTISASERATAEAELVARFGNELSVEPDNVARPADRSRWIAAILLVAVVPAAAAVLYVLLGNPAAVNPPPGPAARATQAGDAITDPQIVAMIDRLAEKMKANPDDPKGWMLLARSYFKMGRYDDSVAAFAEAAKRMPESAELLADQAEAIAMTQGQRLAGRPAELLARALTLSPDDPKTIAMSGAVAAERGDIDAAIKLYRRLKTLVPPNSEDAQQIDQVLAELETIRKSAPAQVGAAAAPKSVAPSAAAPGAAIVGVSGRVEIDPKLAARVAPGDTLFIFARNPEGSRMPLAILKGTASELPKSFTLTDANAMAPTQTISQAKSVVIEARISKSGNATPQSGDLRGVTAPMQPGADKVRIVIDQVVP